MFRVYTKYTSVATPLGVCYNIHLWVYVMGVFAAYLLRLVRDI